MAIVKVITKYSNYAVYDIDPDITNEELISGTKNVLGNNVPTIIWVPSKVRQVIIVNAPYRIVRYDEEILLVSDDTNRTLSVRDCADKVPWDTYLSFLDHANFEAALKTVPEGDCQHNFARNNQILNICDAY